MKHIDVTVQTPFDFPKFVNEVLKPLRDEGHTSGAVINLPAPMFDTLLEDEASLRRAGAAGILPLAVSFGMNTGIGYITVNRIVQ